jgi:hypothetical protein
MIRWRFDLLTLRGNNVRVDIDDAEYSGSVVLVKGAGDQPVVETLESQSADAWRTVAPSSLTLRLASQSIDQFEDVFTSAQGRFTAKLYLNSTFRSQFILLPDLNDEPRDAAPYITTLSGANLSLLKDIPVSDIVFDPTLTRLEMIRQIAGYLMPDMNLVDGSVFYPVEADPAVSSLSQQYVSSERFAKFERGRIEYLNAYDALRLLIPYGHQIRPWAGKLWIVPLADSTFTAYEYRYDGIYVGSSTFNTNTTGVLFEGGRGATRKFVQQPFGLVERGYDPAGPPNLIPGGDLGFDDFQEAAVTPGPGNFSQWPIGWDRVNLGPVGTQNSRRGVVRNQSGYTWSIPGWFFAGQPLPIKTDEYWETTFGPFDVRTDDYLSFAISCAWQDYGVLAPADNIRHYWRIKVGDYYLKGSFNATSISDELSWTLTEDYCWVFRVNENHTFGTTPPFDEDLASTPNFPVDADGVEINIRIYRPVPALSSNGSAFMIYNKLLLGYVRLGQLVGATLYTQAGDGGTRYSYDAQFGDGPLSFNSGRIGLDEDYLDITQEWQYKGAGVELTLAQLETLYVLSNVRQSSVYLRGVASQYVDAIGLLDGLRVNALSVDFRDDRSVVEALEIFTPSQSGTVTDYTDQQTPQNAGAGVNTTTVIVTAAENFVKLDELDEPLYDNAGSLAIRVATNLIAGIVSISAQAFAGIKEFTEGLITTKVFADAAIAFRNEADSAYQKIAVAQATSAEHAVAAGRTLTAGTGVNTIGDLTTDRTISTVPASASAAGHVDTGTQAFAGRKTFNTGIELADAATLESDDFTAGFSGTGMKLARAGGEWGLELDDMFIRGALFASELIINQISALNGSDILSPGRGKVEAYRVTPEEIDVSDPQGGNFASFAEDDIVIIQQVRPNDNAVVKRIVRQVNGVTGRTVSLGTTTGGPSDVGTIEVGDIIVAIGNVSETDRQASIYRSVTDANNPFVRVFTGVDSWADWLDEDRIALAYGNLNGSYGYVADTYGFAAGSKAGAHLTLDPTNGLRLMSDTDVLAQLSGTLFKIGDTDNFLSFDSSSGAFELEVLGALNLNDTDGLTLQVDTALTTDGLKAVKWIDGTDVYASLLGVDIAAGLVGAVLYSDFGVTLGALGTGGTGLDAGYRLLLPSDGSGGQFEGVTVFADSANSYRTEFSIRSRDAGVPVRIFVPELPTSSSGLPTGTLWNDSGTVKVKT